MDVLSTRSLPRRRLGRTGLEVCALGLGGAGIGGSYGPVSDDEAVEAVHRAIDLGIDYIDTSPLYYESERRLGLALAGGWRERVHLATKAGTHPRWFGDYSADTIRRSVENSLKVLGTDYLDVVLVHDPLSMEPVMDQGGALEALEQMKAEKLIGAIGLGVRQHEFLLQAIESDRFDLIITFLDYTLLRQSASELFAPAAAHDVAIVNGSPLAMGLLSGREPEVVERERGWSQTQMDVAPAQQLWHWARQGDINLQALALQFSLRQPAIGVTIVGARTAQEVAENVRAATTPLPAGIWEEWQEVAKNKE